MSHDIEMAQTEHRKESTQRLLATVERLLEEGSSYTELSLRRLVREAEVPRSTFYTFFDGKGALLRALSRDVFDEVSEVARSWWELEPGATREDLRAALERIFHAYRPHRSLTGAVVEATSYDTEIRKEFLALMDSGVGELTRHIERGQEAGTIHGHVHPTRTATWLIWMFERGLYELGRSTDETADERLVAALTDIVWNTLHEGTS